MKALVACEESQAVTIELRKLGVEAYSCDIQQCSGGHPEYSQAIQPYEHGDPWKKRTCLWLRGLPLLVPTKMVEPIGYWLGAHGHNKAKYGMIKGFRDAKTRSKTFHGIAHAMATQLVSYIRETEGIE